MIELVYYASARNGAAGPQCGVPDWRHVTDDGFGTGECVGIEPTADGWSVYSSERGRKPLLKIYPNEDAACRACCGTLTA